MGPNATPSGGRDTASQFHEMAARYASSVPHSSGESLRILGSFARGQRYRKALDVATGPGFTAFEVAPLCDHVVATDPALGMLAEVERLAAERGIGNVATEQAYAESLPFEDGEFDLVTCRTAPHHFTDLPLAIREMRRVLEPGGTLILVDTVADEDREIAAWQNEMEARRDTTHVRDLPPSEWQSLLAETGFEIEQEAMTTVDMELDSWLERSGTPPEEGERLREEWAAAPDAVKGAFRIQPSGDPAGRNFSFSWPVYVCRARRR